MSKLRDHAKVEAFSEAIERVKHLIRGKVVLDVGSGVGILSLLAARAEARMVDALELPGMADLAEQVAHLNTSRIQVVQGAPIGPVIKALCIRSMGGHHRVQ